MSPEPGPRGSRLAGAASLAAWAGLFVLYAGFHLARRSRFVPPGWDEAWQIPVAWMRREPSLYAKDDMLRALAAYYPALWSGTLSFLLRLFGDDFSSLLGWGSAALLAVFGLGNYFLVRRVCGSPLAAFVAAAVLLRPRAAPFNPYGVMVGNFTANNAGIAAAPWLIWAFVKRGRGPAGLAGLGAALGLASWVNPSIGFHLCALFALCFLAEEEGWRKAAVLGLSFAPFFLLSSSLVRGGGGDPPDLGVIRMRSPYLLAPWSCVRALPDALLLPGLLAFSFPDAFWKSGVEERRRLAVLAGAVLVFFCGAYLARRVPSAVMLLSWRALSFLFPVLFCAGACALAASIEQGRWGRAVLCLALWLACAVRPDLGLFAPKEEPALPPGSGLEACRGEFLELASWAGRGTGRGDLFLVPPEGFASFRLYAKRAVVVTLKEGTGAYQGSFARAWRERYERVSASYASGLEALRSEARRDGADWIVIEGQAGPGAAFSNRCYGVLKT